MKDLDDEYDKPRYSERQMKYMLHKLSESSKVVRVLQEGEQMYKVLQIKQIIQHDIGVEVIVL